LGRVLVHWQQGGWAEGTAESAQSRGESERQTLWSLGAANQTPGRSSTVLEARSLTADSGLPQVLKAAYSHPSRLLVFKLTAAGVEPNFEALRAVLQEFKRRGLPLGLPAQAPAAKPALEALQRTLIHLF